LRAQGCTGDAIFSLLPLMSGFDLSRRAVAEALGTAMLVATVVAPASWRRI
jgi:hypothetical protein